MTKLSKSTWTNWNRTSTGRSPLILHGRFQNSPMLSERKDIRNEFESDDLSQKSLRAFEVKLLSVSGFWSINALPHLPKEMIKLLEQLEHLSWNQINEISLSEEEALFLENILRQYIERVLEANVKSIQVMRQLRK